MKTDFSQILQENEEVEKMGSTMILTARRRPQTPPRMRQTNDEMKCENVKGKM